MADDLYYRVSITADSAEYDLSRDLSSLTVKETSANPDELTINLSDPDKVFSHALQEGMSVEVDMGTADAHSILFRGRIYKVDGTFPQQGVPTLRLLAHDASMAMGLRERNRPFTDMTLSDLVNEIAGAYFDPSNIEVDLRDEGDLEFTGNGIRQREKTDLQFLHSLARRYGCEMFVMPEDAGDKLYFRAQYNIMTSEPEVTLYHGRCDTPNRLLTFQANSSVSNVQLPRVISGMDFNTGEPTEVSEATVEEVGSTEDEFADENMTAFRERDPERADGLDALITASPGVQEALREELGGVRREAIPTPLSEEELSVIAANQFSTSQHGMRANGACYGNPLIHAQTTIQIADVGGRFSGAWYLSEVRHQLNAQGYRTEFKCQR